jgi:hypothetical protein
VLLHCSGNRPRAVGGVLQTHIEAAAFAQAVATKSSLHCDQVHQKQLTHSTVLGVGGGSEKAWHQVWRQEKRAQLLRWVAQWWRSVHRCAQRLVQFGEWARSGVDFETGAWKRLTGRAYAQEKAVENVGRYRVHIHVKRCRT